MIALAGPNGAGKSTTGPPLLKQALGVSLFVNADLIAEGLAGFAPERAALTAGKVMLRRIEELAASRSTFAFETTLSGRRYAIWLARLAAEGYRVHLVFLWLPTPEFALERVKARVQRGGHAVPEAAIRRRFRAGLENFFALYAPMATTWRMYDNSADLPRLIAAGGKEEGVVIEDASTWMRLRRAYGGPSDAG